MYSIAHVSSVGLCRYVKGGRTLGSVSIRILCGFAQFAGRVSTVVSCTLHVLMFVIQLQMAQVYVRGFQMSYRYSLSSGKTFLASTILHVLKCGIGISLYQDSLAVGASIITTNIITSYS